MSCTVKTVNIDDKDIIFDMINVYNKAFSARNNINKKNPFVIVDPDEFYEMLRVDKKEIVVAVDKDRVMGGVCIKTEYTENQKCVGYISNVCVDPDFQGKGIAKMMLDFIMNYAQSANYDYLELSVGSVWNNAIQLYESYGFVHVSVSAHLPDTYYLIGMRKFFCKFNQIKIKIIYYIQKLKFNLLFKKDSSPKFLHKMIYR